MAQSKKSYSNVIAQNLVPSHSKKVRKIKTSRSNSESENQGSIYIESDLSLNRREPSTLTKANGQTYELIAKSYKWKGIQKTAISLFVDGNRILKLFTFKMDVKNIDLFFNKDENNIYALAGNRLKIISCMNSKTFKDKKSKKLLEAFSINEARLEMIKLNMDGDKSLIFSNVKNPALDFILF